MVVDPPPSHPPNISFHHPCFSGFGKKCNVVNILVQTVFSEGPVHIFIWLNGSSSTTLESRILIHPQSPSKIVILLHTDHKLKCCRGSTAMVRISISQTWYKIRLFSWENLDERRVTNLCHQKIHYWSIQYFTWLRLTGRTNVWIKKSVHSNLYNYKLLLSLLKQTSIALLCYNEIKTCIRQKSIQN